MIRRRDSDGFRLITQHDHAIVSGALARHIGNGQFAKPDPFDQTILGIAQHDCGWPLHDDQPTLSSAKLPLDVFESPRQIAHKVWIESARRAAEMDPYAGLLVSLHVLSLSAATVPQKPSVGFDPQQMRQQFDLNKFQHQAIELLETLRNKTGLRTDRPLRLGLSEGWTDAAEEQLKFDFHLLQAMDTISLAICCTTPPVLMTGAVHPRPGANAIKLQLHRPAMDKLLVKPWPFDAPTLQVSIPYRLVPERTYADEADLHNVLSRSSVEWMSVEIRQN
jgi:hypothetical protein